MQALKAHVHNGRLVLDEPTDLPEGKEVSLVLVEDDGLTEDDRAALLRMIDESLADEQGGQVEDFSKLVGELRSRL